MHLPATRTFGNHEAMASPAHAVQLMTSIFSAWPSICRPPKCPYEYKKRGHPQRRHLGLTTSPPLIWRCCLRHYGIIKTSPSSQLQIGVRHEGVAVLAFRLASLCIADELVEKTVLI